MLLVLALLGGCHTGGDRPPRLTRQELATTGDTCPVDLAAAVAVAGLEPAPGGVEVEAAQSTGNAGADASALDRASGVEVRCRQDLDEGSVTVTILATEQPEAFSLVLPMLLRSVDLNDDELDDLAEQAHVTPEGHLVDLGDDARAAAARIDVEGAESGVLYVESGSVAPSQLRRIADRLLDDT